MRKKRKPHTKTPGTNQRRIICLEIPEMHNQRHNTTDENNLFSHIQQQILQYNMGRGITMTIWKLKKWAHKEKPSKTIPLKHNPNSTQTIQKHETPIPLNKIVKINSKLAQEKSSAGS